MLIQSDVTNCKIHIHLNHGHSTCLIKFRFETLKSEYFANEIRDKKQSTVCLLSNLKHHQSVFNSLRL